MVGVGSLCSHVNLLRLLTAFETAPTCHACPACGFVGSMVLWNFSCSPCVSAPYIADSSGNHILLPLTALLPCKK